MFFRILMSYILAMSAAVTKGARKYIPIALMVTGIVIADILHDRNLDHAVVSVVTDMAEMLLIVGFSVYSVRVYGREEK